MHVTVGYLATPTGDDGVALAALLAKTFDATVDVVVIVREELPDGNPGRAEYQQLLIEKGEAWVASAAEKFTHEGADVTGSVLVNESFSGALLDFAEEKSSDLIVIGGARDGIFGGHVIGPIAGALLHRSSIPVALAPRGYGEDPPASISLVTVAVPTNSPTDNPLPFALTLSSAAALPIRMMSLVAMEQEGHEQTATERRKSHVAAAEENLRLAVRSVPDAPDIDSLVADGSTLESALKKLRWDDGDILLVGSSRFAAPRRVFLGSTAARILANVDVPVIVVPND